MTVHEDHAGTVGVRVAAPILEISINRPARRNALDRDTATALADALADFEARDDIRVGILSGAGGHFSAGFDLSAFTGDPNAEDQTLPAVFLEFIERGTTTPLIGAVEGHALGAGLELALICDVLVASRGAMFGLPEVTRGFLAGGGGLLRLGDRIPRNEALAIALTGDPISAERAHTLGLVHDVVGPGEARQRALEIAARISANAPLAVEASKQVINSSRDWSRDEAFARQRPFADQVMSSEDALEGARSFIEKRFPLWKNR
jgi:enoyl-CoA hydratase